MIQLLGLPPHLKSIRYTPGMKILGRVDRVTVKRCFAMTYYFRKLGVARHADTSPSHTKYLLTLRKAKKMALAAKERDLDKIIKWPRRIKSYGKADWYIANASTKELGVWRRAGGLPLAWTEGSLAKTATYVKRGLRENSPKIHSRAKNALPAIIEHKTIISREKYLYPIAFEGNFGTNPRRGVKKMKAALDDGNMRAIAYAVSGSKTINFYLGRKP